MPSNRGYINIGTLSNDPDGLAAKYGVNKEMLLYGEVKKYSYHIEDDGSIRLANAYVIDPETGNQVIVNAKNSLLIGLETLAYEYNLKSGSYLYNPDKRMKLLMAALMPETKASTTANIDSTFYKRLFLKTCRRDDIRNCRNGKPYKACFSYIRLNKYEMMNEEIGKKFTENEVMSAALDIYTEVAQPYIDKGIMTPVVREIISETVDIRIQSEYGWRFSHQEYDQMVLNTELIRRVVAAFPDNAKTIKMLRMILEFDSTSQQNIGEELIKHPTLNPLFGNKAWRKMMERELRQPFDIIGETFLEETLSLNTHFDQMEFVENKVREFVEKTNESRLYNTSFLRNKVSDRDGHLNTEEDVQQVTRFVLNALSTWQDRDKIFVEYNWQKVVDMMKMEILGHGDDQAAFEEHIAYMERTYNI